MSNWTQRAKELGVTQLSAFGHLLERHIRANQPALLRELQAKQEFKPFLLVMQAGAEESFQTMVDQGSNPEQAREVALREMLETVQPAPEESPEEDLDEAGAEAIVGAWMDSRPQ